MLFKHTCEEVSVSNIQQESTKNLNYISVDITRTTFWLEDINMN